VAAVAAARADAAWPLRLLVAFLAGKYLLMYGLMLEQRPAAGAARAEEPACNMGWLRRAYHLPGNADVRVHLLALALMTGWLTVELALVAVYYNARWMVRYALVARRLGGVQ